MKQDVLNASSLRKSRKQRDDVDFYRVAIIKLDRGVTCQYRISGCGGEVVGVSIVLLREEFQNNVGLHASIY